MHPGRKKKKGKERKKAWILYKFITIHCSPRLSNANQSCSRRLYDKILTSCRKCLPKYISVHSCYLKRSETFYSQTKLKAAVCQSWRLNWVSQIHWQTSSSAHFKQEEYSNPGVTKVKKGPTAAFPLCQASRAIMTSSRLRLLSIVMPGTMMKAVKGLKY